MLSDSQTNTDESILEWVIILTIFAFVTYPYEMIYLSETSLGKLFFASIVAYCALIDTAYGLVALCFVIVYYQLDLYKSYVSLHRDTLLRESMIAMESSIAAASAEPFDTINRNDLVLEQYTPGDSNARSYVPFDSIGNNKESMFYRNGGGQNKAELLSYFRNAHCTRGQLMHQGSPVRPEMADHVFREIQFPSDSAKCNPCDKTCDFSIIEDRISREGAMVRPVSSRDAEFDWNQFFGHYVVKPVTSIADDATSLGVKFSRYLQ